MIKLAYKLFYKLQERTEFEFNDSLAIMYIVHLKCQQKADYTSISYTPQQIKKVIKLCLKKEEGTYLPEGTYAISNSKRIKMEAPGFKLVKHPLKDWRKIYDNGHSSSPTSDEMAMLTNKSRRKRLNSHTPEYVQPVIAKKRRTSKNKPKQPRPYSI